MRLCALSSTSCWTGTVSRSFWAVARHTWITYADILRDLEPLNEGRDKRDRITYDSLWIHAKRHYDLAGESGLLENPDVQGVQEGPAGITGCRTLSNSRREVALSTKKVDPWGTLDYTCATGYLG